MKIAGKLAVSGVVLCVVAAAAWTVYHLGHRNQLPQNAGRNLEFHLLALNGEVMNRFAALNNKQSLEGPDVFSDDEAKRFIASGEVPAGWKWLPVASTAPQLAEDITRMRNGSIYALVADRPDMVVTHAPEVPAWGIKSAELNSPDQPWPTLNITFDDAGANLVYSFTQKYVGHSMAIAVGGKIFTIATIVTPIRCCAEVHFNQGQRYDAEKLRDLLLSGAD